MSTAIAEAKKALANQDIPVGAIVTQNNLIIGRGHNQRVSNNNVFLHAEIVALQEAGVYLNNWRLDDCILYTTLEPCIMCTGAIIQARVSKVIFGALDEKAGCILSQYTLFDDNRLGHKVDYEYIRNEECSRLLSDFFRSMRKS